MGLESIILSQEGYLYVIISHIGYKENTIGMTSVQGQ